MYGRIEGSDLQNMEELMVSIANTAKRTNPNETSTLKKFITTLKEDIQKMEEVISRNQ